MSERITEIPKLPPRSDDAHKGRFGRVLIVGGSRGMIGAPALAANAALRSGAGLVRIAVPESVQLTTAGLTPCATSMPLTEDEKGLISSRATHDILNAMDESDSLAFGPGLAQSNDLQLIVEAIVKQYKKPLIIDADGLNNLTAIAGEDLQLTANTILTPHPGEMAGLWRAWFREDQPGNRTEQAEKLSQRCGAVVVLKGAGTIVTDGERT
ncbi:MAG: NAD(P)H-hydrate dehydratase, partial [Sedimentisphaerales bacterium]|nr:NAD(P)H-hydrate dehydratase [Sedimentisphaerales bacterium]